MNTSEGGRPLCAGERLSFQISRPGIITERDGAKQHKVLESLCDSGIPQTPAEKCSHREFLAPRSLPFFLIETARSNIKRSPYLLVNLCPKQAAFPKISAPQIERWQINSIELFFWGELKGERQSKKEAKNEQRQRS